MERVGPLINPRIPRNLYSKRVVIAVLRGAPRPEEALEQRWKCPKCGAPRPRVRKISTTGGGLSRLLDIQHIKYYAVSCTQCGYTELYDASVLDKNRDRLMDILDIIIGG